jgi:hypothetical protein
MTVQNHLWQGERHMLEQEIEFWIGNGKYKEFETNIAKIWLSGVLSFDNGKTDIIEFSTMILRGNLDFNTIVGWFRIVIYDKQNRKWYLFGDNSNSQHFFYNERTGLFSDSFLSLKAKLICSEGITPNYSAINELLGLGFTSGDKTIVKQIKRTEKDSYYVYDGKSIIKRSKKIKYLSELKAPMDICEVLEPLYNQIKAKKLAAVCTGGTDSRTVISALSNLAAKISFVITGHDDNPDLIPARQICKVLNAPLTILNPDNKEDDWIEKGFIFTDGEYDAVLSHRHFMKAQWEIENGIEYEFGGLAGEFYKNVFCQPFRWFGTRKDPSFYYNAFFKSSTSKQLWIGEHLKQAAEEDSELLMRIASSIVGEHTMLEKGNHIGFDILSWKSGAITNGYASIATKIDPLMDRQLCAFASHDNCFTHSMHCWQRKQIEKNCKIIADIPTDQGYTCSMKPMPYIRDCFKKASFNLNRVFNRIRRKLGFGFKEIEQRFWDYDYMAARKTTLWIKSVRYCRDAGIINPSISDEEIPLNKTGWIITIGLMFA